MVVIRWREERGFRTCKEVTRRDFISDSAFVFTGVRFSGAGGKIKKTEEPGRTPCF
jgi:hypothetical protein